MATTFNWIHLGSSETQLDPTEGNDVAENAKALVGQTYGTAANPLFSRITSAKLIDNGGIYGTLDQNNSTSNDQFTTNLGSGSTTLTFDAAVIYDATVTYADGTRGNITAVVMQDTSGQLFLAPEKTVNDDTTVLEAKPILSLTLNSVNGSTFSGMATDRVVTGFDDGYIDGSTGDDLIDHSYAEPLGNGSDKVDNGDAARAGAARDDDYIRAGGGNDRVHAGLGNDQVFGGDGEDRLYGGAGNDTLAGGLGNDHFAFATGSGSDTVVDFDLGVVSGTGTTNDQLDVSDLRNAEGAPVRISDVVIGGDGKGNAVLKFPGGESVVLLGISPDQVNQSGMLHAMGVPCFVAGTLLRTPQGARAVEAIGVGDLVLTPQGALPVLWHGQRRLGAADLALRPDLRPVTIAAGAVGNCRELRLSPQHAVLVPGRDGGRLIRARHLIKSGTAWLAPGLRPISYHHLLLPVHSMIWAEGALAESFYPGSIAVAALRRDDRLRLCRAIVGLDPARRPATLQARYGPRCQTLLTRRAAAAWLGSIGWGAGNENHRQTAISACLGQRAAPGIGP